jgi:hypothetical protein
VVVALECGVDGGQQRVTAIAFRCRRDDDSSGAVWAARQRSLGRWCAAS